MSNRADSPARSVPPEVLDAYGWGGHAAEPLSGGLINATYRVVDARGLTCALLQQLHPVFVPEVNLDLEAVTRRLASQGLETPFLLRPRGRKGWVECAGRTWRALTFVDGVSHARVPSAEAAESAGETVGRFHRALDGFAYRYASVRTGVHDTAAHLARLAGCAHARADECEEAADLAREIAATYRDLPACPAALPLRHSHGDLKISNVLFERAGARARCLVDLDTCGLQPMAHELGDLLRSWCNVASEDCARPELSHEVFSAALRGYARGSADLLDAAERDALLWGMTVICVELAARFCVDAFEQSYFGWDPVRFASRREHNLVRARGQLELARLVSRDRRELERLRRAAFTDASAQ